MIKSWAGVQLKPLAGRFGIAAEIGRWLSRQITRCARLAPTCPGSCRARSSRRVMRILTVISDFMGYRWNHSHFRAVTSPVLETIKRAYVEDAWRGIIKQFFLGRHRQHRVSRGLSTKGGASRRARQKNAVWPARLA